MWNHQMTQFTFYSSSMYVHFVPTRTAEISTKRTHMFLLQFLTHAHSTHALYLWGTDEWYRTEWKGAIYHSSHSFPSMSSFQHVCWFVQGLITVGKEMIGFLGHFHFFKCHCLLFVCRVSSGLNGKHGSSGFWASHSNSHRPNLFPSSQFEHPCTNSSVGPPGCCTHGVLRRLYVDGGKRNGGPSHGLFVSILHCPTGLHLQNSNVKISVLLISRWWQECIETNCGALLSREPCVMADITHSQRQSWHI